MADISEERLREIIEGTYCGFDEGVALAAEPLAARAEVERLTMGATKHRQTEATYLVVRDENTRLRAEVAEAKRLDGVRLAQIASLQEIIRNDTTPAGVEVTRFRAEVERLRSRVAVLERVQESASLLAAAKAKFDSLVNERDSAYDAVLNGDYTAPNLSDLQQEVNNAEKEQDDAMDAVVQAALDGVEVARG